jgi:hypothetical protein
LNFALSFAIKEYFDGMKEILIRGEWVEWINKQTKQVGA